MYIQNWVDVIGASLIELWTTIGGFLPRFLGSIIIFFIGWAIAVGLGQIVERAVKSMKLDSVLSRMGMGESLHKAGLKLDAGMFIGGVVKWFLIIAFLLASVDILGLSQVSMFLQGILSYIPDVLIAVVILVLGVLAAKLLRRTVEASTIHSVGSVASRAIGSLTRWAILIFAIWAALLQLDIATAFLQIVLTGLVAMLAIAGGLAFGLGGRDAAKDLIEKARNEMMMK